MNNTNLAELTGLNDSELSYVFESNPRAYMAVRGAVAEVHLHKHLQELKEQGVISKIQTANGDMDKDFYITTSNGNQYCIECKNVEVIKITSKPMLLEYIKYLIGRGLIEPQMLIDWCSQNLNISTDGQSLDDILAVLHRAKLEEGLKKYYGQLDQSLRESGLERYRFSASRVGHQSLHDDIRCVDFLMQFDDSALTIDMQRTRNTQNEGLGTKNRFYAYDEIDIVAVCLFSRTTKWEFVFTSKHNLIPAKKVEGRFHNIQKVSKEIWSSELSEHFFE